jgi:hypothetical protein
MAWWWLSLTMLLLKKRNRQHVSRPYALGESETAIGDLLYAVMETIEKHLLFICQYSFCSGDIRCCTKNQP